MTEGEGEHHSANTKRRRTELRSILGFSLPISVANYVQPSCLLADSIIVGHYVGVGGLAAVGAAQPIFYLVNAVFLGLVSGFAIRFARMTGAGQTERQQDAAVGLTAFAVVRAALCTVLVFSATGFFMNATGIHDTVAHGTTTYLRTLSLGFVGMFGIGALGGFLRGLGDSRAVMYIMVSSSLLNIVLAWSFVALLGLGLRGAALGTVPAGSVAFVAGLVLVARRHGVHRYRSALPEPARQDTAAAFTTSGPVREIVGSCTLMTYPFLLLYTATAVVHGFLNGIGRTVFPLVCTMRSFLVVRIPSASLLKEPLGLDGIIWAVPIGWFAGLAYTACAVRRYVRDVRRFIPVPTSAA
ncbi:MATE family efflux transporter [Streptomyces sp. NPDC059629]|uniref:MATE family efflux transporter n=1 Tax=Streptomyces sp. NPDC059629 TaxID=3346889 RepID=UPI003698CC24